MTEVGAIRVTAAFLRRVKVKVKTGDRSGALEEIDAALAPAPLRSPPGQLALRMSSFRVFPEAVFVCRPLGCELMKVAVCVARQQATDAQRTQQSSRGQGTDYPHCDTRKCGQGRAIREALNPNCISAWEGAGFGGRFQRERRRSERAAQEAARARATREGRLDPLRTLDIDADPQEEG